MSDLSKSLQEGGKTLGILANIFVGILITLAIGFLYLGVLTNQTASGNINVSETMQNATADLETDAGTVRASIITGVGIVLGFIALVVIFMIFRGLRGGKGGSNYV